MLNLPGSSLWLSQQCIFAVTSSSALAVVERQSRQSTDRADPREGVAGTCKAVTCTCCGWGRHIASRAHCNCDIAASLRSDTGGTQATHLAGRSCASSTAPCTAMDTEPTSAVSTANTSMTTSPCNLLSTYTSLVPLTRCACFGNTLSSASVH